ncbi:MAG: 16S rRNA (cytidine(1402)-2'-O)-methyltransferase [Clostridia bacterium]|nr:16S rRNA (cytidine(1402)-2'-O)-methyltransferase [Clostridia bacterium]
MEKRLINVEHNVKGTLFLVGTPIGNLKDITLRALDTLKEVDIIAAEDTRHTQKLLNHYSIQKSVTSYYEHNKLSKGPVLIDKLCQGKNIALVSDAGMPGISDPGYELVKECVKQQITITVIPGPSALITGVVASGLDCSGFVFAGFFPRQGKDRKKTFDSLERERRTLIFYESPHRLCQTLLDIKVAWGDRQCCVARELTKVFEEYQRGTLSEVIAKFEGKKIKGEITIIVEGMREEGKKEMSLEEIQKYYAMLLKKGFSTKDALKEIAQMMGISKREIYNKIMIK